MIFYLYLCVSIKWSQEKSFVNMSDNINNLIPCWPIHGRGARPPPQPPTPSPASPTSCWLPPPSGRGKRSRCGRGRGREWEQVKIMAMVNSMLFTMAISLSTTISMPSSKTTTKSTISTTTITTTSTTKPSPSSSRPGNNLFARVHPPKPSCPASDQKKVKTCMFNTTSIDECCPTFNSILGTSCPCYKYAEDLDNQVLITLESYCDVIKLSKDDE
ncbi:hypothetical protein H5410_000253 [Solanum commersonii]|uniref:Uncharacterized protein n=1 Tax=Solanum commersonii TaxID=4109 RepID=A0A9J6AVL8_SOLCO|nr:hypothetical protein H5410_000253 [Solanum commersonii]